ncbi:hypothetical protein ACFLQK_00620 [bacterium]
MFDLLKNILQFGFTILGFLVANYILVVGIRDIIHLVAGMFSPKRKKKPPLTKEYFLSKKFISRIIFWLAFCAVIVLMIPFILPVLVIMIFATLIFRAAERNVIGAGRAVMLTAVLIVVVTALYVRSQPVLQNIENQLSIDLWIYNAANSLIDAMLATGMKIGMDTSGIERLAALVPYVQENVFVFIAISVYIFCVITAGKLAQMILPATKYRAPVYYMISPEKFFLPAGALMAAYAWYANVPQLYFVIGGVYYAWGVNLLVFALRGGWWPLNLLVLFTGVMHPAPIVFFVALGVLDNLFDFRRAAAIFGALGGNRQTAD